MGPSARKLNLVRIDLAEVIEYCVARARTLYHIPEESLSCNLRARSRIQGDLDEVRAAISNLIDNAVKYSGKDVQIVVETADADGKYVTVRVKDRGEGIARTELKRVFKRFYRVPGQLTTRVKGTGLGLYIVRSVAKRHKGRAWAESEGPGRGSTFVLQFPIAK